MQISRKVSALQHVIILDMKKGILVLIPIIVLATYMSRPVETPAQEEVTISIVPSKVIQGDPVLVIIDGLEGTSTLRSLRFKDDALETFDWNGKLGALIGIDLRLPVTTYHLNLTLSDGRVIQENLVVGERAIAKAPFGIPEKLGGNTPESEKELVNTLAQETQIINSIPTADKKLWSGRFRYPLNGVIEVTDVYGYSRLTGASILSHKGTDFRADIGTPVYAMNSGVVAYIGYLRNYGNLVVIDHGLGLQTIYMHLLEVSVSKNQSVGKGTLIGKSGDTGYVMGPHLHLSVKIDHISIDPERFMQIFGPAGTSQ